MNAVTSLPAAIRRACCTLARTPAAWLLFGAAATVPAARADTADYISPSVAIGGVYDDNLFLSADDRQSDEILRISPALEFGYGTESFTLAGFYTFDAERYRKHPELNGNTVRRNGALDLGYQATPRLNLALDANYTSTETPSELSPQLSVGLGRAHAVYETVAPSAGYSFDELTYGRVGYLYEQEDLASAPETQVDTGTLGLEHRFTERDSWAANFAASRYDFGPFDQVDSRVFTLGWNHLLTPTTSFNIDAGPRQTAGVTTAEYGVGITSLLDSGTFSFQYNRSQAALIGEFQPADTRSAVMKLDYIVNDQFEVSFQPSWSSDTIGTARATLWRADLSFNYRISRAVSLVGSYEYNLQQGLLTGTNQRILRNVVYVGLVFSAPVAGPSAYLQRRGNPFETLWPAPQPQISPVTPSVFPNPNSTVPTTTNTDQQNETPPP